MTALFLCTPQQTDAAGVVSLLVSYNRKSFKKAMIPASDPHVVSLDLCVLHVNETRVCLHSPAPRPLPPKSAAPTAWPGNEALDPSLPNCSWFGPLHYVYTISVLAVRCLD